MTSRCIQAHVSPTRRGVTRPVTQHRSRLRQAAAAGVSATLLAVSAACTSDPEPPREEAAPSSLPSRTVESGPTLEPRPVPMQVTVGKVLGDKMRKGQRRRLEKEVARILSRYFDAAYLGGEYPRSDFSDALAAFSPGAVERAAADRSLLSNAGVGATTVAVVPRIQQAHLDVFKPKTVVAGLTARVRLVFVEEREDGADQRTTVQGRLLMSRKETGPWQIFGYDVTRSSVPAAKGDGR